MVLRGGLGRTFVGIACSGGVDIQSHGGVEPNGTPTP